MMLQTVDQIKRSLLVTLGIIQKRLASSGKRSTDYGRRMAIEDLLARMGHKPSVMAVASRGRIQGYAVRKEGDK